METKMAKYVESIDRRSLTVRIARICAAYSGRTGLSTEEALPEAKAIVAEIETTHLLCPREGITWTEEEANHVASIIATDLELGNGKMYEGTPLVFCEHLFGELAAQGYVLTRIHGANLS